MGRRLLTSVGPVVLIAASVTTAALVLGSSTGKPRAARRLASNGVGSEVTFGTYTSRTYRYTSNHPPLPLTPAEMRAQGELVSRECGIGAGGHRAVDAPLPQTTLVSTYQHLTARLYVIGQSEVICTQNGLAGDSVGDPQQTPAKPASTSIAIAAVTTGSKDGQSATLEYGRVGPRVRRISFILAHGGTVPAAVGGGWFLVWWLGSRSPTAAQLTTAAGTWTQTLGADAASPATACPPRTACYSTASPGRVVSASSPAVTGLSGGGSFSGTIVPGPSTVLQHGDAAPGPVKTAIGPRRSKHITVKLTQLGSG